MSSSTERGDVSHAHQRIDSHDTRITQLERWMERVKGGIAVLAFLIGSGLIGYAFQAVLIA
jgi:hypothetical protein